MMVKLCGQSPLVREYKKELQYVCIHTINCAADLNISVNDVLKMNSEYYKEI